MYIPQRNRVELQFLEPPERTQIGHHQRCSVAHTAGGVDTCMLVSADAFSWLSSVTRGQEPAFFFNISEFLALVLLQSLQSSSVIWNTPVVGPVEAKLLETRFFQGSPFFILKPTHLRQNGTSQEVSFSLVNGQLFQWTSIPMILKQIFVDEFIVLSGSDEYSRKVIIKIMIIILRLACYTES